MPYADDSDNSTGCWIHFEDGHSEYWNNTRLHLELTYRGLALLKTQIKLLSPYKKFHDHIVRHRLVKEAPIYPTIAMCKICNKNFDEIVNSTPCENCTEGFYIFDRIEDNGLEVYKCYSCGDETTPEAM